MKEPITDALRQAIEGSDRTYAELAEASGVAKSILSRFLSGQNSMTLVTADRLARALGLELVEKASRRR